MITKKLDQYQPDGGNFPLWLRYEPEQAPGHVHRHEFVELAIITSGNGTHKTKYSLNELLRGSVIAIPEGGEHVYSETHNMSVFNIIFDPKTLPIPLLDLYTMPGYNALFMLKESFFSKDHPYPFFNLKSEEIKRVELLLNLMREECATQKSGQRFTLMGLFMALLSYLSRAYSEEKSIAHMLPLDIGKVISYLSLHYRENIESEKLIHQCNMSRSTFLRNFQRSTGCSPIQYLLKIRISHACRLLLSSDYRISEIGFTVGFQDQNYFSRCFKNQTGMTPREFRQHYEKPRTRIESLFRQPQDQ